MSFWGIEVKPGKPITHSCEKARGRLRISQATLGIGEATKKTVVQCNVGNRAPVLLCALLPDNTESCHLDLEFEEADDVVFSVIGPRSVYLTGYYVRQMQQLNANSDTESYGVDIENTQTEGSSYGSDDENYEDSFIDDDDELQVAQETPVLSNEGMDEDTPENVKPKGRKDHTKQRKKKFQVMESDNDDTRSPGSEDEDEYTLSAFRSKRAGKTATSVAEEQDADVSAQIGNEANDKGISYESKQETDPPLSSSEEKIAGGTAAEMGDEANDSGIRDEINTKVDPLDINDDVGRAIKLPLDRERTGVGIKMNDLANPKEADNLGGIISSTGDIIAGDTVSGDNAKDSLNDQKSMAKEKDQKQSCDITKPKKKRKERSMKEKTCELQTDATDHNVLNGDKKQVVEASTNMEKDVYNVVTPTESCSVNDRKIKKRKTELQLDTPQTKKFDKKHRNILKDDAHEPLLYSSGPTKDLPTENGEHQKHLENLSTEGVDTYQRNMCKEEEFNLGLDHDDSMPVDPSPSNGEQQIDNGTFLNHELVSDDGQHKKIKKKKKKAPGRDLTTYSLETTDGTDTAFSKCGEETIYIVPVQSRTLSNGLTIEALVNGPPGGRVAAPGKVVKIFYKAMLKENGFVFDTNVGKTPYKFRLGGDEFIDGWNLGIDGMHVGDKRRLIIPPTLGFGSYGSGENVPPNSWLVYEIELVSVRK